MHTVDGMSDAIKAELHQIAVSCYLNCSLCYMKQEKWANVKYETSKILALSPLADKDRVKALYRRGLAFTRHEMDVDKALECFEEAYFLDGGTFYCY